MQVVGGVANDPPGATCSASGDTVQCSSITFVSVDAGGGNDTVTSQRTAGRGTTETMFFTGGPGDDTLTGGPEANAFTPGPGADRVRGGSFPIGGDFEEFVAEGGSPSSFQRRSRSLDSVAYEATAAAVRVSLDGVADDGAPGELDDLGPDVEVVVATNGNDVLTAGAGEVEFYGRKGDDVLTGSPGGDVLVGGDTGYTGQGGGSDSLSGGAGDDVLRDEDFSGEGPPQPGDAPAGVDRLAGGEGDDRLETNEGADDVVGGPGDDEATFFRSVPAPPPADGFVPLGFTITLDDRADDGATGRAEGDNVHSDVEDVTTSGGPDVVRGSAAANVISTGDGADQVTGGAGVDTVDTGTGNDTIDVLDGVTDSVDGGTGTDSANADLAGGQPERADRLRSVESVTGTPLPTVVDVLQLKGAPPVVTPPNAAPTVTVTGTTVKVAAFLKAGGLTLRVSTNEPARVTAELLGRGRFRAVGDLVVGTGGSGLASGRRNVRITVGKADLAAFKRKLRTRAQKRKGVSLKLRVVATDALGLPTTLTRTVRVRG